MARKKYLEEDSENVNKHHHLSASYANHALLHDSTNIKFGHQQQKLPLNSPVSKTAASSHKKGKKHNNGATGKAQSDDSYGAVMSQLSTTGLTLREMPGDGNCLFRALADQLEGNSRNHMEHRRAVVEFMRKHRPDFEPFVEDDEPFEKYIQSLAQNGTFAGNDAIVAFARLHDVTVVIHQLNSPAWLIHPSNEASYCPSGREIHIAYHNGDHYNSVRKLGDDTEAPANIKLGLQGHSVCASKGSLSNSSGKCSPPHSTSSGKPQAKSFTPDASEFKATPEGMYESLLYGRRDEDYWIKDASDIDRLVAEVMGQTDCSDPSLIREALMEFHFDIPSTVDYILSLSYFIMSQPQDEQQPEEVFSQSQMHGDVVPAAHVENCSPPRVTSETTDRPRSPLPPCESVINNSNQDADAAPSSMPENLTETAMVGSTTTEESQASTTISEDGKEAKDNQNQENVGPKNVKVRMSSSQRKFLKKQERKRESNQRKVGKPVTDVNPSSSHSHSPTLIPANIDTLNI